MKKREELERRLIEFVQTPDWSPDAEPPEDNADWRAGYEAAQSNLREELKPWWPLAGCLNLSEEE